MQAQIKEEEEVRRRREVAVYLYGFVRVMARHEQDICGAMREIWQIVPQYDPDSLAGDCQEIEQFEMPDGTVEELNERTLAILPPPFEWMPIPAGQVTLENDSGTFNVQPFLMAKYPITYAQFQVFVDADDGFKNDEWWQELDDRETEPGEQRWPIDKHPREEVNWYDAVAFCNWLSFRLSLPSLPADLTPETLMDYKGIRLPTEWEWQWAAQGPDGRVFPWGNEYIKGYANIDEKESEIAGGAYLQKTTAVGSYPDGASPYGVLDMSGNVYEWCLNEYETPANIQASGNMRRAWRGGSWITDVSYALAAFRLRSFPGKRDFTYGFRLAASVPVQ